MLWIVPAVAGLLLIAILFVPAGTAEPTPRTRALQAAHLLFGIIGFAGLVASMAAPAFFQPYTVQISGLGAGFLAFTVASVVGNNRGSDALASWFGYGLAIVCTALLKSDVRAENVDAWIGFAAATCIGAVAAAASTRSSAIGAEVGLAVGSVAMAIGGLMGAYGPAFRATNAGFVLGLAGIAAGMAAWFMSKQVAKSQAIFSGVACAGLVSLGAWLLAERYFQLPGMFVLAACGALAALATAYLLPEDGPAGTAGPLLAGMLWVATATYTFSEAKGFGLGIALLGAAPVLIACRSAVGVLTANVVVVLAFYRLFRLTNPDMARAFDIGQHYAVMGIIVGILLTAAPIEWARRKLANKGSSELFATFLAGVAWVVALYVAAVFFGPKGALGIVVGAGIGSLVVAVSQTRPAAGAALGALVPLGIMLMMPALNARLELERSDKLVLVGWTLAVILVCYLAAQAFANRKAVEVAS